MKKQFLLAAALLIPTLSQAEPFAGPYAGIYAGYGRAEDKGVGHDQATGASNGWTHKFTPDGAHYGILGGYNWRLGGNYLIGLEADFEGRSGNDDRSAQKLNGVSHPDFSGTTKLKSAGSLRGRIGYIFGNHAAVYATAGYAGTSLKRTWHDAAVGETESHSTWQSGWAAGIGFDYLLTGNLAARLEVRHTDYGKKKVVADLWGELYRQRLTEDAVRVALSYQF